MTEEENQLGPETLPAPTSESVAAASPPDAGAMKRKAGGWTASVQSVLMTAVIATFVITFAVQAFQIPSESMEKTLLIGDYLLVDKAHYGPAGMWSFLMPYRQIRRGDTIVFRYPVKPSDHFVKRVIGLPGDRVYLQHKQVYINGKPLTEPYVVYRSNSYEAFRDDFPGGSGPHSDVTTSWFLELRRLRHNGELTVPANRYFVLGDNRDNSLDSRFWGLVPAENIVGRPLVIYWSMQTPTGARAAEAAPQDGKLASSHFGFERLLSGIRWGRMLRVVE